MFSSARSISCRDVAMFIRMWPAPPVPNVEPRSELNVRVLDEPSLHDHLRRDRLR